MEEEEDAPYDLTLPLNLPLNLLQMQALEEEEARYELGVLLTYTAVCGRMRTYADVC